MGSEDVKVTAMNMYKYKERLRLYKRWPCVGPVGLTHTWFIWDRNLALHITLYSVNSVKKYKCYTANVCINVIFPCTMFLSAWSWVKITAIFLAHKMCKFKWKMVKWAC